VAVRRSFKGCKEVFRVVTSESDAFVQAMMAEDGAEETEEACLSEMPRSTSRMCRRSSKGEGVDHRYLGLRRVLKEGESSGDDVR